MESVAHRLVVAAAAIAAAAVTSGCQAARVFTGNCQAEVVEVVFPATLDRASGGGPLTFSHTLEPSAATVGGVDLFENVMVRGQPGEVGNVSWTATASENSAAGIPALTLSVMHKASLARGEVLRVEGVASRAVWATSRPPAMTVALVNLDRWPSMQATGTITVVQSAPVILRFDVATRDDNGAAVRLRGDASFRRRTKSVPCFT